MLKQKDSIVLPFCTSSVVEARLVMLQLERNQYRLMHF